LKFNTGDIEVKVTLSEKIIMSLSRVQVGFNTKKKKLALLYLLLLKNPKVLQGGVLQAKNLLL